MFYSALLSINQSTTSSVRTNQYYIGGYVCCIVFFFPLNQLPALAASLLFFEGGAVGPHPVTHQTRLVLESILVHLGVPLRKSRARVSDNLRAHRVFRVVAVQVEMLKQPLINQVFPSWIQGLTPNVCMLRVSLFSPTASNLPRA
jgi:hypothetical protein